MTSTLKTPAGSANRGSRYTEPFYNDYFPAVLLEAGSLLAAFFVLCVFLVPVVDFALCACLAGADEVDEEAGAAAEVSWANTEPERATPATSREAIASLRIMIMSLEIFDCHGPGRNPAYAGGVTS
ncbi:hypothetical protein GCM10011408_15130 [Dyella caseinilytica]|nr:hypothetical protein GCM10011408_15130 [Dyella caseinilytica]